MPFVFLAGQCTVGLWQLLPWDAHAILLLLPALSFLRGWSWMAFAGGALWQWYWMPETMQSAHDFFWFLGSAESFHDPIPSFFAGGRLDHWAGGLAQHAQEFFLGWDSVWGPWFLRFALGVKDAKGEGWARIYEELGLLHVLVVSGAHFSFIGAFCQALLEGPGRLAYALRLLPFSTWLAWVTGARILLTLLITIFALMVGFNPPCQRSWLSLLLQLWLPLVGAPLGETARDRWVFTVQAFCFPGSFMSLSNALSWSAYTLVRAVKPWPRAWQRRLLPAVEGPLIAMNLSYFGFFSPWGLFLNTLLQPVWHLLLGLGLLYWVWPEAILGQALRWILQLLHEGLLHVYTAGQQNGPIVWQGPGAWARALLWVAASWTFFRLWRQREDACGKQSSPVT